MNDAGTLSRHMLDIRELTAEAFAPYGQVIAPLRTGGQGAETGYDPEASFSEAKLVLGNGEPRLWIMHLPHVGLGFTPDCTTSTGYAMPGRARRQRMADRGGAIRRPRR
jgi:hypothetical protein